MKRFLFLDDDHARHDGFRLMTIGCDVDHVYRAHEAIDALMNRARYDFVYLDHDLDLVDGIGQLGNSEENGTVVAEFIRTHLPREKYPTHGVWIHSWNPEGAERMRRLIAAAGIAVRCMPFRAPGASQ